MLITHKGWCIAMNIGREPGSSMPREWAASGCRIPVSVQCDFNLENNEIVPITNTVRFTGPKGEVMNPVRGEYWSLSKLKNGRHDVTFTFMFPEELVRRDVTLKGTVCCKGCIYSKESIKEMDKNFYEVRNAKWDAGEQVADVSRKQEAPKKWNPATNQWEKRYEDESSLSQLKKIASLMFSQRMEQKVAEERPNPKDLSLESGPFPGISSDVYFKKEGKVFLQQGWREFLIGTWIAEPINDKPKSYY